MGPLVTKAHRDKVAGYLDVGTAEGAELVVDGRRTPLPGHEGGFFLGGSLFDNATPDMRIYREEIFGPVLSMVRAQSFTEALRLVNDQEFGNGTAIFTADGNTARTFLTKVKAGMVGGNVPTRCPCPSTPSAAGSGPCSGTTTSTAPKVCASTPATRPPPPAGPTTARYERTSPCRPTPEAFAEGSSRQMGWPPRSPIRAARPGVSAASANDELDVPHFVRVRIGQNCPIATVGRRLPAGDARLTLRALGGPYSGRENISDLLLSCLRSG